MYLIDDMIELGLPKGKSFPNKMYKDVAVTIGIGNPNVNSCAILEDVVQSVLSVPKNRIKTVTYLELVKEFGMPDVEIFC